MKAKLFRDLIHLLQTEHLPYAVLGNTEAYPDVIGGDVDIMILPSDIHRFQEIIWKLQKDQTQVIQLFQHETVAFYYILASTEGNTITLLQPDVCSDYVRNGTKLLSASDILQHTKEATNDKGEGKQFQVLSPDADFIYYLLKKIDKASINAAQFSHLASLFNKNPDAALRWATPFWSSSSLSRIHELLEKNDLAGFQQQIPILRAELHRKMHFSLKNQLKRTLLHLRRCLNPTGFVIHIDPKSDPVASKILTDKLITDLYGCFRRHAVFNKVHSRFSLQWITQRIMDRLRSTLILLTSHRTPNLLPVDLIITVTSQGYSLTFPQRPWRSTPTQISVSTLFDLESAILKELSVRTAWRHHIATSLD